MRAKVPRRRWTWKGCVVCRSPWTGRTLNKDPGYEVRNMLHVWRVISLSVVMQDRPQFLRRKAMEVLLICEFIA